MAASTSSGTAVMVLENTCMGHPSIQPEVERLHDPAVALDLAPEKCRELLGPHRRRRKPVVDERLPYVRNVERAHDFGVQAIDDRLRRAAAHDHAKPVARVEARIAGLRD